VTKTLFRCLCCVGWVIFDLTGVAAQELYRSQMNDGSTWGLLSRDPTDTFAAFDFDYSAFGIPEAPNSLPGDSATRGLQMKVNLTAGVENAIAAYPIGLNFSGKFVYQFDMWLNAIGPFPEGGNGSTELGGGSVGFDNATTVPFSGAGFQAASEAGTTRDYRLYAHSELQTFPTHLDPSEDPLVNDLFDPKMTFLEDDILQGTCPDNECGGDNADGSIYLQTAFPGLEPPQKQQDDFFLDQFGTTKDGAAAFQWMTVKFTVDTDAGTAFVQITSATSGNTADIGTFNLTNTYVNRATIDTKLITDFEGNISLTYNDPFVSVVQVPELSFGLYDNVMVTQLESDNPIGDYNDDGTVNAADYTVWRDRLGQDFSLPNEDLDTTAGKVTIEDYNVWKSAFGNGGSGNGALAGGTVPEPASCLLLIFASSGIAAGCRVSRHFGARCQAMQQ
jgi:hypothetical protein